MKMNRRGYAVEVTNLSPNTTEKDVYDFCFLWCNSTCRICQGDDILNRPVCIAQCGYFEDDYRLRHCSSWKIADEGSSSQTQGHKLVPSAGEAVSLAQNVVKTMAAKGYVWEKMHLGKLKHLENHTGTAKVAELSKGVGLTDKIVAGVEAARSMDQRYHISGTTKSAASATTRTAVSAANAVVNSNYFSKGALWLSGALSRASQVAGDFGSRGGSK